MTNAEEFLATFRQIEKIFRERTNSNSGRSFINMSKEIAKKDKLVSAHWNEIEDYCELRNALVHRATNFKEPLAEPHSELVQEMKTFLENLKHPPKAYDISIKGNDIGAVSFDMPLEPAVEKMISNGWTILPVLNEKGLIECILSEYSLVKAISNNSVEGAISFKANTVKDISDFLDKPDEVDINASYIFKPMNTLVLELESIFVAAWKDMRRINAVFITEDGLANQPLLGLITPWDLLRLEDNSR